MEFNSKLNYDYLYNYNSASVPVEIFYPLYEHIALSDSVTITEIKSVSAHENPILFVDAAWISNVDFSIGSSDKYDSSFDWFMPLPMKVDWANTSLQIMPTSESEYIDMPNVDGSMVQNTTYKNRAFNFVLYSNDGLSDSETYDLKEKIAKILDGTKTGFKKLSIPPSDHYFEVKYSGSASIQDGPSFVKATLPFEVKPYSHPIFEQKVVGKGTITNNGLKPSGLVIELSGYILNPYFDIVLSNGDSYSISIIGEILAGYKLVINNETMMCYYVDPNGTKTNAMAIFRNDPFRKLDSKQSATIIPSESTINHITCTISESYIW